MAGRLTFGGTSATFFPFVEINKNRGRVMKRIVMGIAVVLGAVSLPLTSYGAFLNGEKIEVDAFVTPGVSAGDQDSAKSGVKTKNWLRIKFSFRTEEKREAFKFGSNVVHKWEDDMSVEAVVLVPSQQKGKPSVAAFIGEVKLAGVKYDGGLHFGRMFVPPFYIDRYLRPGNSFPQKSGLKDFTVQLTFKDKSQKVKGMLFYYENKSISFVDKTGRGIASAVNKKLGDSSSKIQKYENAVVGPEKTPWAFSEFDSYEFIKPKEGR